MNIDLLLELTDVIKSQQEKIEMLEEECAAMREQLSDAYDGQGYGIQAIKPRIKDAPVEGKISREEAKRAARKARGINEK